METEWRCIFQQDSNLRFAINDTTVTQKPKSYQYTCFLYTMNETNDQTTDTLP